MKATSFFGILALTLALAGCRQNDEASIDNVSDNKAAQSEVSAAEWQNKVDALNGQLIASQQALTDAKSECQRLQALLDSQTERLNDQLASISALEQDLATARAEAQVQTEHWEAVKSHVQTLQRQWLEFNSKFPEFAVPSVSPPTEKSAEQSDKQAPTQDQVPPAATDEPPPATGGDGQIADAI